MPFTLDWVQIVLDVVYHCTAFGKPWIVIVFWTLAVEFQYYVLRGLACPLVASATGWCFVLFVALCIASALVFTGNGSLPSHWPPFLMGMAVFRCRAELASRSATLVWITLLFFWSTASHGLPNAGAAAVTAMLVLFVEYGNRLTDFFGTISYSLYLIHEPVGNRICNIAARFSVGPVSALLSATAALPRDLRSQ